MQPGAPRPHGLCSMGNVLQHPMPWTHPRPRSGSYHARASLHPDDGERGVPSPGTVEHRVRAQVNQEGLRFCRHPGPDCAEETGVTASDSQKASNQTAQREQW